MNIKSVVFEIDRDLNAAINIKNEGESPLMWLGGKDESKDLYLPFDPKEFIGLIRRDSVKIKNRPL